MTLMAHGTNYRLHDGPTLGILEINPLPVEPYS